MTGRRRLLLGGLLIFTIASALSGAAPTLWLLIAARAAQGIGAAVMMALTMAFVGDTVPKERTGTAMGLLGAMSAIGTALGPSLGGFLISAFGWPAIFLFNVPLGIVALLLARLYLPADRRDGKAGRTGFDMLGTLLLALTLAAYALSMTLGRGRFGSLNVALLLAAVVGVAFFVRAESRAPSPLIRLAMLRKPGLSTSLAVSTLVSTVMMATLVVGPFYLSNGLGLDAPRAGIVVSVGPLVVALTGVPAGLIADRFGARPITLAGLVAIASGAALLYALPASSGVPGYVAPLVVMTAGYALFQTANNAEVMGRISHEQRGIISATLNLSRNLGLVTGASLMGAVFEYPTGTINITSARPEAVAVGMQTTFAVAAMLIVAALAVSVARYLVPTYSKTRSE
jgi:MFS family permease